MSKKEKVIERTIKHIISGDKTIVLIYDTDDKGKRTYKKGMATRYYKDEYDECDGLINAIKDAYGKKNIDEFKNVKKKNVIGNIEKSFLNGKIKIHCKNEKNANTLFRYLLCKGISWNDGENLIDNKTHTLNTCWDMSKGNGVLYYYIDKGLRYDVYFNDRDILEPYAEFDDFYKEIMKKYDK